MKFIKSMVPYVVIIVVVVLIRTFLATPVKVNGESMYPTLKGGEVMLLSRISDIKRYDIVVLKVPEEDGELIKRVIGMPGEKIEIMDSKIYINGKVIDDEYGYGVTYNINEITLGDDEYFVLGDNRLISLDSRKFGPIKKENIKGTTNFILYPFKSFGKVSSNN